MPQKMSAWLSTIEAVLKLFVAGKDLQVELAVQVAYLEQSEYTVIVSCQAETNNIETSDGYK